MRKLLLILTASLAMVIAACGGGTGTTTDGTTESLAPVASPSGSLEASPSAS